MFTYAELISIKHAMEDKIARDKKCLNASHIDEIEGLRSVIEDCLETHQRTLFKVEQLLAKHES